MGVGRGGGRVGDPRGRGIFHTGGVGGILRTCAPHPNVQDAPKVFHLPAPPSFARSVAVAPPTVVSVAAAPFPGLSPTMPILACVLPALTFLCQPALDALQACVGNQAQSFFTFLASWAGGLFARCWEGPGVELPELASEIVGAEETLSEIRSHLRDDSAAGIIGIYGMGGVGKSTILRRIHNELLESGSGRGSFDLMIWVTVSRTVNISQIQKQIADRLGLSLSASCTDEENAGVLFKALSEKRFLVLLDDLWEALDLQAKIGIPSRKMRRNSKIVLTTRSSQVCCDMDADEIVQVKPLDEDPSWELFCSKLLRTKELVRNSPTIRQLAQQVVRRCGGLPLALVTVGRAMANKMLPPEWEHAVEALDHSAEQLHGMEEVLGCLKFSYDNLKNDKMRSALLLCAMYPEDDDIRKEGIIKYWFGEGMLDDGGAGGGSIEGARNRGHVLISQLQDACLLEPDIEDPVHFVRMHDAVRDMGRWLNSHEHDNVDGFIMVCDGGRAGDNATGADQSPERVKRIWMRGIDIDQLLEEETSNLLKYYPSNRTLVLKGVQGLGPSVLQGIAGFMKTTLRVLDLSESDVEELPGEVGLMVELRYLELCWTRIKALPKELGNLVKLRILGLGSLQELPSIPREAMAGLWSLQLLDMSGTSYDWGAADSEGGGGGGVPQLSLGDLESGLRSLQELHIELGTRRSLVRMLESDRLCRCTRSLHLRSKQSEDPLYGEGGSSLLQRVFDKTGSSLRILYLAGDDDSHPWVGGLRISLDQLPRLEILVLDSFKKLSELVLVGTDTNHRSGMAGGWTPPSSVPNTCLVRLWISHFDGLKVLKLVGEFPSLRDIDLSGCKAMEVLALDDGVEAGTGEEGTQDGGGCRLDSHFPMLRSISLTDLPRLKSIGLRPLRLPELRYFSVYNCPELRRIPLDVTEVPKLESIVGEPNWWAAVEFASHNTKPVFEKLYSEWN